MRMGDMTIAAMSVDMHQAQAQQELGLSVMKMAMDSEAVAVDELIGDMASAVSVDPGLGANVDIMA